MRYRLQFALLSIAAVGFAAAALLHSATAEVSVHSPSPKLERQQPAGNNEIDKGRHVFMAARCFACHGEYGYGGVGPRFRENRFLGMADYVVGQILIGRGVMPSFAEALDNQQIADVATYIRNSWGNDFGTVKPTEVAQVRQQIKLNPPQDRPHLPPESEQPKGAPMPPHSSLPPGQALPPGQSKP